MRNRWAGVLLACLLAIGAVEACRTVAAVRGVLLGPGLQRGSAGAKVHQ